MDPLWAFHMFFAGRRTRVPETRALPVDPYPTAHASTTPATRCSHPAEAPRSQPFTVLTARGPERWTQR